MHAARVRRSSLREGDERRVGQTPDESLRAALHSGDELLFFLQARAEPPYALHPLNLPDQQKNNVSNNRQDIAREVVHASQRPQGLGPRLRNLLSFDRERERDRVAGRAIADAFAEAPSADVVLELYAVVRSRHSTPAKPHFVIHRALDNTVARAVHIVSTWSVSDLKSIDGLGVPAATALQFCLTFSEHPPILLVADNSFNRARFLWSLSQLFARELKRAPPTTGILLLELQSFADETTAIPVDSAASCDHQKITDRAVEGEPQQQNSSGKADLHLRPIKSMDRQANPLQSRPEPSESADNSSSQDRSRSERNHANAALPKLDSEQNALLQASASKTPPKIVRTVSEPNPNIAIAEKSKPYRRKTERVVAGDQRSNNKGNGGTRQDELEAEDEDGFVDGPVALRQQPATAVGLGDARKLQNKSSSKAMNIDQRAFLVAASRLGGLAEPFGDSPTALLMERRRIEEERRAFQLTDNEKSDFDFVVSTLPKDQKFQLGNLESWLETEIARLEVANISETLSVERDGPAVFNPLCQFRDALTTSEGWFRRWGAQIAPHADIVAESHSQILSLEVQRRNIMSLDSTLQNLVSGLLLSPDEESQMDEVFSGFESRGNSATISIDDPFILKIVVPVALALARKVNYSPENPLLLDINSVASYRKRLLLMRKNLSSLMFPSLKRAVEQVATAQQVSQPAQATTDNSNADNGSCRSDVHMVAFCKAAYAATVLETTAAENLCSIYERVAARESSFANESIDEIRRLWNASGGDIRLQLRAAMDKLEALVLGEGQVAMRLFKGVARAMGISPGVLVTRLLICQFQHIVSSIDKLVDYLAAGSLEAYWVAFLDMERQANEKYRQSVLCGAEHVSLRTEFDHNADQSVAIYGDFDVSSRPAARQSDVIRFPQQAEHSASGTVESFASARSSFFLSSNTTVASPALCSNRTQHQQSISVNDHQNILDEVSSIEDCDSSAVFMFLSNLLRERARRIRVLVDVQVGETVAAFPTGTSRTSNVTYRNAIFDAVQSRLSMFCDIARAWFIANASKTMSLQNGTNTEDSRPSILSNKESAANRKGFQETKSVCDRLVAAAMKIVENAAVPGPGRRPDIVKVECYTSMAMCLSNCSNKYDASLFSEVLGLAQRGMRFATNAWTARMVRTHFGNIIDAAHAAPGSLMLQLQTIADHLGTPNHVIYSVHQDMMTSMSSGAKSVSLDKILWPHVIDAISGGLDAAVELLERRGSSAEHAALAQFRTELVM